MNKSDLKLFGVLTFVLSLFLFVLFGLPGLLFGIFFVLVYWLPYTFIISKFFDDIYERIILSLFFGLVITPTVIYYVSIIGISFKLVIYSFICLIILFIVYLYFIKKMDNKNI